MQELSCCKKMHTTIKNSGNMPGKLNGGNMTAFDKLHDIYKTQEAIAKAFKVKRQTIGLWKKNGIPAIRAAQVERLTKGKVSILDIIKG
jgi:hypothetical protein